MEIRRTPYVAKASISLSLLCTGPDCTPLPSLDGVCVGLKTFSPIEPLPASFFPCKGPDCTLLPPLQADGKRLAELDLGYNEIKDEGACAIAQVGGGGGLSVRGATPL